MKRLSLVLISALLFGCSSPTDMNKATQTVQIMIVAKENGMLRLTYLDHHVLRTVYQDGDICLYDTDKAKLEVRGNNEVYLYPNDSCTTLFN